MFKMSSNALKIVLVTLLLSCGCSSNSAKDAGYAVGSWVLDSAAGDFPATDAMESANDIRKSAEQSEHAENVEELSTEYAEFLRKRRENPEQENVKRSVVFREPDPIAEPQSAESGEPQR